MKFVKQHWMVIMLILAGLATRFIFIWWPNEVVFDEVHTGKVVVSYLTGRFDFFDVHPPLGKLLIAFALWLSGFQPGFGFASIGDAYSNVPYVALRFLPNLLGGLIPIMVFWLARELNFTKLAAFSAGILLTLDNALITHTHFALLDAFMLFFGLAGLAAFLRGRKERYALEWLALSGLFIAFSVSSKWVGLAFLASILIVIFADLIGLLFRRQIYPVRTPPPGDDKYGNSQSERGASINPSRSIRSNGVSATPQKIRSVIIKAALTFIALPAAIYLLIFALHFELITEPGQASAFLKPDFLSKNFFTKFVELNKAIYTVNAQNLAPHPYSSTPYTWPLMTRSVYYWVKNSDNATAARIYLLGNPAVWWSSTFFGALAVIFWRPRESKAKKWLLVWLWLIALVPFLFVARTLFLYHYFTALTAAVLLMTGWLGDEPHRKTKLAALGVIFIAAAWCFFYFAPLTYGFFITEEAFKSRLWLPGWL